MTLPWQLREPPVDPLKYSKIIGGLGMVAGGLGSGVATAVKSRGTPRSKMIKGILAAAFTGTATGATEGLAAGAITDLWRQKLR
jgi:hypothetical protein